MLPVAEIVAVVSSLDDRFRCPLGDAAAQRWGYQQATFLRSSASHVFVAGPPVDGKRAVLRMRPAAGPGAAEVLHRSAAAAELLAGAGAPVAGCVRSPTGALVERVRGYLVTAQVAVEGDPRGSDDLDDDTARAWGILLADLHDRGATVQLPGAPSAYAEPPTGGLAGLPRTPPYVGLLHGDPEIDNVVWTAAGGTFVDLDDVRHGWYVGDVGYALRDWAEPAGPPDLTAPVPRAFLAGYRSRRTLTDEELSWLPALAQASAAETLAGLEPLVAGPPDPGWPDWALAIDRKVRDRADVLRQALVRPGIGHDPPSGA